MIYGILAIVAGALLLLAAALGLFRRPPPLRRDPPAPPLSAPPAPPAVGYRVELAFRTNPDGSPAPTAIRFYSDDLDAGDDPPLLLEIEASALRFRGGLLAAYPLSAYPPVVRPPRQWKGLPDDPG
jgi:hypothetical protein